jgi:hypothetical protein
MAGWTIISSSDIGGRSTMDGIFKEEEEEEEEEEEDRYY